jgi:Putative transposase
MQGTATHLVDRVLPRVPMRQWVLSLPRWARFLLARDPALITRTLGLALRGIFARHRLRARRLGVRGTRAGAVTFVQRFGSALNLNVHFHCLCCAQHKQCYAERAIMRSGCRGSPQPGGSRRFALRIITAGT